MIIMNKKIYDGYTYVDGGVCAALAACPAVKLQLADGSIYAEPGKVVKASGVIDATTGSVSLIARFGSLDGVYAALDEGNPEIKGAVKTKLENGKEELFTITVREILTDQAPDFPIKNGDIIEVKEDII